MKKPEKNGAESMSLAECASYLHLTERTVLKLVQEGKLPGVTAGRKWTFQRASIDEWLQQQQHDTDVDEQGFEDVRDGMRVPLDELLPAEAIIEDLRAETALGVVEELAARAYSHKWLSDKPWFVGAVVEREALASTAMEGGVAFLHTRSRESDRVARPFVVVGRSYNGIDFGAPDGKPTFLFFLLGLKYDKLHLPILGRLARVMRSPTTVAKLRSLPSITKIRALLLKKDAEARASSDTQGPMDEEELRPKLDRQMRLRTIMRLDAQRKHRARQAEEGEKKTKKKRASKKAADKSGAATSTASRSKTSRSTARGESGAGEPKEP